MPSDNEIFIYDEIGPAWWGLVDDKYVIGELNRIGRGNPVTVRINSPGGDVQAAQSIYNALRRHSDSGGQVTIENDALAASAASYVMMAGDVINVAENSMTMIHKAWTIAIGNTDELRATAGVLEKFDGIIASTYAARSKQDVKDIAQMLADETWMTAGEAVELGFADAIGQSLNGIAAKVKPGRFLKTPKQLLSDEPSPVEAARIAARQVKFANLKRQIDFARQRIGA